ncbi:MAG: hypothetical protein IKD27_07965 [Oscillospiraceae bacterium]|nr:hypothetical protein [Oscillospiraceae bacterium]
MAWKNATANKLADKLRAILNRLFWVALQDLNHSMIVKHRITGKVKVINK